MPNTPQEEARKRVAVQRDRARAASADPIATANAALGFLRPGVQSLDPSTCVAFAEFASKVERLKDSMKVGLKAQNLELHSIIFARPHVGRAPGIMAEGAITVLCDMIEICDRRAPEPEGLSPAHFAKLRKNPLTVPLNATALKRWIDVGVMLVRKFAESSSESGTYRRLVEWNPKIQKELEKHRLSCAKLERARRDEGVSDTSICEKRLKLDEEHKTRIEKLSQPTERRGAMREWEKTFRKTCRREWERAIKERGLAVTEAEEPKSKYQRRPVWIHSQAGVQSASHSPLSAKGVRRKRGPLKPLPDSEVIPLETVENNQNLIVTPVSESMSP
jgi:hypothetical protein